MQIYPDLDFKVPLKDTIVTMGSFDGVHQGHRKILERVVSWAKETHRESVLITFDRHPSRVLKNRKDPVSLLTTPDERRRIFESVGIDHLVCLTFDEVLASMEPEDFIQEVFVDKLHASKVITGYGHRFGKGGRGDFLLLTKESEKLGFEVEEIPRQDVEENMISSTRIRKALLAGDVELAAKLLGYHYTLSGEVVSGSKIGREMGFPTANIQIDHPEKLIPADGVYAVKGRLKGKIYKGMMNIGYRPTFHGKEKSLEVHFFGLDEDIYGTFPEITFYGRVRDEQRFSGVDALKQQLMYDQKQAEKILLF